MLAHLHPDDSYDGWLHVGMALHAGGYSLSLWDDWSKRGQKYEAGKCQEKWQGFNGGGGVTMGTLVYMAKQGGYCPAVHTQTLIDTRYVDTPAPSAHPEIPLYHWRELEALPSREYLIKGLIDKGASSVIYGASNSGKTFIALDIAFHIAAGRDWRGQRTKQGRVVYIAGEGGIGIRERLAAILLHYETEQKPDVYIIPTTVTLCGQDAQHQALIDRIAGIDDIQLIVVDTLARAMAGGDENSTKDMSEFVRNCDIIRHITKAHIIMVHHSGKDDSKGARGSSALKAAIDTEMHVSQANDIISATVQKQREGKTGVSYNFLLRPYEVGKDEDGEAVTSCALEIAEGVRAQDRLTGQAEKAYDVLVNLMIDKGVNYSPKKGMKPKNVVRIDDFRTDFFKAGIAATDKPDSLDKAFYRAKEKLKSRGYIGEWDGYIWLLDKKDKTGQTELSIVAT